MRYNGATRWKEAVFLQVPPKVQAVLACSPIACRTTVRGIKCKHLDAGYKECTVGIVRIRKHVLSVCTYPGFAVFPTNLAEMVLPLQPQVLALCSSQRRTLASSCHGSSPSQTVAAAASRRFAAQPWQLVRQALVPISCEFATRESYLVWS